MLNEATLPTELTKKKKKRKEREEKRRKKIDKKDLKCACGILNCETVFVQIELMRKKCSKGLLREV